MNKYKIEFEHTCTGDFEVVANSESEAEDTAFEVFEKDELIAPMITKLTEVE